MSTAIIKHPRGHNILEEVLGLDASDLEGLSRYQLAALALECIDHIEDDDKRALVLSVEARGAVVRLRNFYD